MNNTKIVSRVFYGDTYATSNQGYVVFIGDPDVYFVDDCNVFPGVGDTFSRLQDDDGISFIKN